MGDLDLQNGVGGVTSGDAATLPGAAEAPAATVAAPLPVTLSSSTEPPRDTPRRRRRKLSPTQRRKANADRQRAHRERQPEVASHATRPVTPAPVAGPTPAALAPVPAPTQAADQAKLDKKIKLIEAALSGTIEMAADGVQLIWLDPKLPHLGEERSDRVAALWAPMLAEVLNDDQASWLPWLIAGGGTAKAFYSWAAEYQKSAEAKARGGATP